MGSRTPREEMLSRMGTVLNAWREGENITLGRKSIVDDVETTEFDIYLDRTILKLVGVENLFLIPVSVPLLTLEFTMLQP